METYPQITTLHHILHWRHRQGSFCSAPSQWEMALHCNAIYHWLGAYTEWSQHELQQWIVCVANRVLVWWTIWGNKHQNIAGVVHKQSHQYSIVSFLCWCCVPYALFLVTSQSVFTLKMTQNSHHCVDSSLPGILYFFLNEYFWFSNKISLKYFSYSLMDDKPALALLMAW